MKNWNEGYANNISVKFALCLKSSASGCVTEGWNDAAFTDIAVIKKYDRLFDRATA